MEIVVCIARNLSKKLYQHMKPVAKVLLKFAAYWIFPVAAYYANGVSNMDQHQHLFKSRGKTCLFEPCCGLSFT